MINCGASQRRAGVRIYEDPIKMCFRFSEPGFAADRVVSADAVKDRQIYEESRIQRTVEMGKSARDPHRPAGPRPTAEQREADAK